MLMFVTSLVFIFIIRLRFPSKVSIATILKRRYGNLVLSTFRDVEKLDFKLKKTKCDINFLQNCIDNNLTPAFVRFRLYDHGLQSSRMYRNFQKKLLENELKQKQTQQFLKKLKTRLTDLRNLVSVFDFAHLFQLISTILMMVSTEFAAVLKN